MEPSGSLVLRATAIWACRVPWLNALVECLALDLEGKVEAKRLHLKTDKYHRDALSKLARRRKTLVRLEKDSLWLEL